MQEEFWIRFIQVTLKVRSWSQLRLWVGISHFGEIQLCQSFHIHRHGDVHRVHRRFDLNALKRHRWSTQPLCRCTRPRWWPGKDQPQEIGKVFTAKPSTGTKALLKLKCQHSTRIYRAYLRRSDHQLVSPIIALEWCNTPHLVFKDMSGKSTRTK